MTWEESILWLRTQNHHQDLVRDCYYGEDLADEWGRYHRSAEWMEARRLLGTHEARRKALDLGAGRGIVSHALVADGWRVVAVEPDPSPVVGAGAIRRLASKGVCAIRGFGEHLPLGDTAFDAVLGRAVLHHSQNLNRLCMEVSRVMKKGGVFLAMREHVVSRSEDLPVFLERHPLHRYYGGENAFTLEKYLTAFQQAELRIQEIFGPACSDINLHPKTKLQEAVSRKKKLFNLVPLKLAEFVNKTRGKMSNEPGRLYSFLLTK